MHVSNFPVNVFAQVGSLCLVFGMAWMAVPQASAALPENLSLSTGNFTQVVPPETLHSWYLLKTEVTLGAPGPTEIVDPAACPTEPLYCSVALSRENRLRLAVVLDEELSEERVRDYLESYAAEIDIEPVNARFGVNSTGQVVVKTPEQNGIKLDLEESETTLIRALTENNDPAPRVILPGTVARPAIVGTDIERLGLKELIGEGRTDFKGSPKNRVFNINRALKQYDGLLIGPGEEFSFVDFLGEVDGASGYLPELVIKNNKTEPEFGGGICQVSTTVFRAAIYSGLKITERRNHSYPVQYYKPYGFDATIYIPRPDLKFENNTPGSILIQPVVQGSQLIVQFYGTSDGRKVVVDGPHILESNPDGSMKTVFTQLVTDASGEELIKDAFWSNYKSPALFPKPGDEILREKPKDWSNRQWDEYRKTHGV